LIDGLVHLDRSVVTFDPPGSGYSTRAPDLGISELHGCAEEALDVCGVTGPVDVLGHSVAGLVVLGYPLDRPQRRHRAVRVGTGSGGPAFRQRPGAVAPRAPHIPAVAALGSLHLLLRRRGSERALNTSSSATCSTTQGRRAPNRSVRA
jgi:pimeloyl-ACP methyl ester carboxylesterase